MVKARVYSIATSGAECVLLLEEVDGPRLLPIWIGIAEGQAIALKFANINLPRPLTHDIMINALRELGYKIEKVIINDLKGQTFYAQVHLAQNSTKHVMDSRPSDAIALAVRAGCEIFIENKVFEKCHTMQKPITEDEVKKFKDEIKSIKPEDFIKGLKEREKKQGEKNGPPDEEEGEEDGSP